MDNAVTSVGLAGDGDEISAIYDVQNAFNIKFDYDEAPNWITAGDLFASLKNKLSEKELAEALGASKIVTKRWVLLPYNG